MSGQELVNTTLRINAAFSFLSGLVFILFDQAIVRLLTGEAAQSILPMGIMLIGFSIFVLAVSMLRKVSKVLVGSIILSDILWVLGSAAIVIVSGTALTSLGQLLIIVIALVIAVFAFFQTKGLRMHLAAA